MPLRFNDAQGYDRLPYRVRRVVLDNHLILFTVDEAASVVYIVGVEHGSRLPRPGELHGTLDDVRADVPEDDEA